jgi:hypothetical protein
MLNIVAALSPDRATPAIAVISGGIFAIRFKMSNWNCDDRTKRVGPDPATKALRTPRLTGLLAGFGRGILHFVVADANANAVETISLIRFR